MAMARFVRAQPPGPFAASRNARKFRSIASLPPGSKPALARPADGRNNSSRSPSE